MARLGVWCEDVQHWHACRALTVTQVLHRVAWMNGFARADFESFAGAWEQLPRAVSTTGFLKKASRGEGPLRSLLQRLLVQRLEEGFGSGDIVFLVRDTDRASTVVADVTAVAAMGWPFAVVAMLPNPEIEAWQIVLAEVSPEALESVTTRLGFSPVSQPTRLSSTTDVAGRDCKGVRNELGLVEWTEHDWAEVSISRIASVAAAQAGRDVGLAEFVRQVKASLVDVLEPKRSPPQGG